MYIEHPYRYDGKYYANVDGKLIEITKEVAYAMNNFYRSSLPKTVALKDETGEVVGQGLREIPCSEKTEDQDGFSLDEYPDSSCDVEDTVIRDLEYRDVHEAIGRLDAEERMIIYGIYFENKTQMQMAEIMGVSRQAVAHKLKGILNKMRRMYLEKLFKKN